VRRAVVTGAGIVSSLGNSLSEVEKALRAGEPRIAAVPLWKELGLRCQVAGVVGGVEELADRLELPRRNRLAMSNVALYASVAARAAVDDAGLAPADLASRRTGVVVGCGTGSAATIHRGGVDVHAGRARRVDPYAVLKTMASAPSAAIVHLLGVGGRSYSMSSACATSAHAIGHAAELVRAGLLDVAIAGGAEEIDELVAAGFSALRAALASRFNDRPAEASRPFAADRDGFVPASGAGVMVLEAEESARRRGARIRAELAGFGATSEGFDLVLPQPEGEAAAAAMMQALADAGEPPDAVDYVNAHGTATVAGDLAEAAALRRVFGARLPPISSTKSLGGHALGATGAIELVHCLLMIEGGFLAPSANSRPRDPLLADLPVVESARAADVRLALSNSFGFGGTNAALALRRIEV
jgi:3-oxoacyl-[acyl-carrier-protein] synthase-1